MLESFYSSTRYRGGHQAHIQRWACNLFIRKEAGVPASHGVIKCKVSLGQETHIIFFSTHPPSRTEEGKKELQRNYTEIFVGGSHKL
jgi:hypothetical protein